MKSISTVNPAIAENTEYSIFKACVLNLRDPYKK